MTPEPRFLRRFERLRTSLRRYQAAMGLAATILVAALGLGFLAWSDFYHELPRSIRAIGFAIAMGATLLVVWTRLIEPLRWWTQPRTAREIEARFPELGQRIRTVVQFSGHPDDEILAGGVKPGLVQALDDETEDLVTTLPLERVIRWRRALVLALVAALPVAFLAFKAATNPEWRVAIQRSILVERHYTTLEINPGDLLVDQGEDASVAIVLKGRPRKELLIKTRPLGRKEAPWASRTRLAPLEPTGRMDDKFEKVKEPFEYRVEATREDQSPTATIRVRYPLVIRDFEVKVTSPDYTGLDPKTIKGGDIQAVEGSVANFRIAFDEPPSEASLVLTSLDRATIKKGEPEPAPTIVPLAREGNTLIARLDLSTDLEYKVVARTLDGRILPKNKYRIDVREDRAPRVVFDEPDEALEVHTLAEVRHRVRVDDDFGLSKAGIVFRFNDGDEQTLIFQDFPRVTGKKPKTTAILEETLLLETLNATPQDSVTYFAFAEDNFPGNPRRTETDLRYIDLRAFLREYKLAEPGSGDGDPLDLIALEELIARQRVNLNRANRLARQKPTDRTAAENPLQIAGFEETLLALTKEFTAGIEALADARVDSLHKALDAMQAAIDSLDRSRFVEAPPAMSEALRNLVAARRELAEIIGLDPALAAMFRKFDRKQAQKIRKPKSKDEEAEELVARLEELAKEEDFVYATIVAGQEGPSPQPSPVAASGEPEKTDPKPANDGMKAQGGTGKNEGSGKGGEGDGGRVEPRKIDRREVTEKQEKIADEVRDLEEKLKRIEAASDLAKERMEKAAEKVEKASGDLSRGDTKSAIVDTKTGAGMLHELARQLKGEIAREAADKLAMARDLADKLAREEADLANRNSAPATSGQPGESPEKAGKSEPDKDQGETAGTGLATGGSPAEQGPIDRMAEMAKTLEEWLKQIDKKGEGKAADAVREILDNGEVAEIVERTGRMNAIRDRGKNDELGQEAKELASKLENLGQALEVLHRTIVAPELASLVELERKLAELMNKLGSLKTEAEVAAWKREMAALNREMEKAGIEGASDLTESIETGGGFHWDAQHRFYAVGEIVPEKLKRVSYQIKDRVQELILKDLASARDEPTPPAFREMVDRYYEVISRGVRKK